MNRSLEDVFAQIKSLYPDSMSDSCKDLNLVYGEVLVEAAPQIAQSLHLTASDVLIDLGAGLGKLAIALHCLTPATIVGIELHEGRFQQALAAQGQLAAIHPHHAAKLSFICQDFLSYDLSKATVIYCGSTCFSESLMYAIVEHINSYTNIKYVATLKPFQKLRGFERVGRIRVECSWDSAFLYVSKKNV